MNIRKGLGRVYSLFCGAVLLGICIVAAGDFPTKGRIDSDYHQRLRLEFSSQAYVPVGTPEEICEGWSVFSDEVKRNCDWRRQALTGLSTTRISFLTERLSYLLGTALALYAARKAVGWVMDGFSSK